MARKVKFSLKMSDGAQVRTIEELREHFDIGAVLDYYIDGRLSEWLTDRYYDEEAQKVNALASCSNSCIIKSLCDILDVPYSQTKAKQFDLDNIARMNERREHLKKFTADDAILEAVDRVAFSQEELADLLASDVKIIYLCGEYFIIPGNIGGITYIGVNNPVVEFDSENVKQGIDFQNLNFDIANYLDNDGKKFFKFFAKNSLLGVKMLRIAVENESAKAQSILGSCFMEGFGVEKNEKEGIEWIKKAAEQGNVYAQLNLGHCYRYGLGVRKNGEECVKWTQKAAAQGNTSAQTRMGICYEQGFGVDQNAEEAVKWYRKAAEQNHDMAQYYLGFCYRYGIGVKENLEKAIDWFQKSLNQGNKKAKSELIKIAPQLFKISDVILYAVGGRENLNIGTKINMETGEIDILVDDRAKVNESILGELCATTWIEPKFYVYTKEQYAAKEAFEEIASLAKSIIKGSTHLLVESIRTKLTDAPPNLYFLDDDLYNATPEIQTVQEDLGEGWIHMKMEISADMKDDFDSNVLSQCSNSLKESNRALELSWKD